MKICYLGDGGSVHNHFMVEWFLRRGHEILFLTDDPGSFPFTQVMQVIAPRHGWGPLRHLYAALQVRRWIQRWAPDVVHAHNVTGYGYWGALSGFTPLVLTAWGSDLNILADQNPLVRFAVSHALRKADFITGDAEALCRKARELSGEKIDVRLFQWGIDFAQFQHEPDDEYRRWIRGGRDLVFISTRRLRAVYNIDVIIRAFKKALSHLPSSRLILVGDDADKQKLEELTGELDVGDHVLFTGWLSQDKLIDALLSSDVFLSVPSSDSTALSLLEAFAARLAVIVSDLPANHEWIEEGRNGLFSAPGDEDRLAAAMIEIARDSARIAEWGRINRRIAEERGDREKEMQKLEAWYFKTVSSG
ncbi:MAG: glycosyltransferase [Candidatus Omnitrophica bacterium]|nr:glycosyltransferase [Candidatus Omnitrophota bacterium]